MLYPPPKPLTQLQKSFKTLFRSVFWGFFVSTCFLTLYTFIYNDIILVYLFGSLNYFLYVPYLCRMFLNLIAFLVFSVIFCMGLYLVGFVLLYIRTCTRV